MRSRKKPPQKMKRGNLSQQSTIAKLIGEERGSVAQFARALSKSSGKKVAWGTVNNWKVRGMVSRNMVLHVHRLTGVPLKKLL